MATTAWFTLQHDQSPPVSIRQTPESIAESVCRRHLEKVARSVTFGRADQLRNLLVWLGERALATQRIAPSEKEIASAVLHRKDFDPQTDSLVRKEMSRLREKLTRYYLSEGSLDEIRIDASIGYLPVFDRQQSVGSAVGASCWLVLPFRSVPEIAASCDHVLEELLIMLAERGGPLLVSATTALAYRGRTGDVRQFAAECHADFVVEGSLRHQNDIVEAAVWLVDGRSGHARRSRRLTARDATDLARLAASWLLEEFPVA